MIIPINCPHCNRQISLDMEHVEAQCGRAPKEGDLSICDRCGEFWVFGACLVARKPDEEERDSLCRSPIASALAMAWRDQFGGRVQ